MIELSIIILNWNTRHLLQECLQSLEQTLSKVSYDVWIVDNNSSDGSQDMIRTKYPTAHLIANTENVGFARANNQAMQICTGSYMLLFNSDAVAIPDSIQALIRLANARHRAGIVGAHLLNTDGSFQASHTPFPNLWSEFMILSGLGRKLYGRWYPSHGPEEQKGPQIVDYVEGACLLVRREAYQQVGGLDENFFMYAEEVDWCYLMKRAGWEVWYEPKARIIHHGGGSSHNRRTQREGDLYRSRVNFFRKHYGNASAWMLKALIYSITAIKVIVHGLIRWASRGRWGRPVISLNDLHQKLKGV